MIVDKNNQPFGEPDMKAKQQSDQLYSLLDAVFEGVNQSCAKNGTGLSFEYRLEPQVLKKPRPDKAVPYNFTVKVREMGHGERELQTIPFMKPANLHKYNMEVSIIMSVFTILAEFTFLNWIELGKVLNQDEELQKVALGKK
jgi:hypothetical protein